MIPYHPRSEEEALTMLLELGLPEPVARQLIGIAGASYAPSICRVIQKAHRESPHMVLPLLESIPHERLQKVTQLNRYLRMKGMLYIPVASQQDSATIARRVYNGLRFLARLAPFPDGS